MSEFVGADMNGYSVKRLLVHRGCVGITDTGQVGDTYGPVVRCCLCQVVPGVERCVVVAREHGFLGVGPDGEVHQRVPVIDLVSAQDVVLCPVGGFLVHR